MPRSLALRRAQPVAALALALVLVAPAVTAQHAPVVADRPGLTVGSALQARGTAQLEGGWHATLAGDDREHTFGETLLRVGVHHRLELRVALDSYVVSDAPGVHREGMRDAMVGAKLRLVDADGASPFLPQAALVVGTTLPTGHRAVAGGSVVPSATLAATWQTTHGTSLTLNAGGANRAAATGGHVMEYGTTASFAAPLTHHAGAFVEYAQAWTPSTHLTTRAANVGAALLAIPSMQLDAWMAVPVAGHGHRTSFGVGVVRRF
jgi:hypothetical protein